MNTFKSAASTQVTRTTNGMKALKSSASKNVDLFFNIGAMRGKNVIPSFVAAFAENPELAVRIALWARDARGGAGERKVFRDILDYLSKNNPDVASAVIRRVPELGRWDDLFSTHGDVRTAAFEMIGKAIKEKNGLAAKWMPRKGTDAIELRKYLDMTPKQYRKTLVGLTKVVETNMCAKDWDAINFNHVPSVASSRYKKAFARHTPEYAKWVEKLVKSDPTAKVNAGAVYPYDVLKGLIYSGYGINSMSKVNLDHVKAQWNALPNYIGDGNVLALVDVSGSMTCKAGGYNSKSETTCLDVAVSLGLYVADKNVGKFKDMFLTFSTNPELLVLNGDIIQKIQQMVQSSWAMSTDLHRAMDKILTTAIHGNVPAEEMPKILLIMSDMQFNQCTRYDHTAMQMIEDKYRKAGYAVPQIVFWNLNASGNTPVEFDKSGTALVSGFSPAIVKSVLAADLEQFSPEGIMLKAIMTERYDY